jgi:crossover junction endodeoxyribonuclease RuvC
MRIELAAKSVCRNRRILGIDPGFTSAGYAILAEETGNFKVLEIGTFKQSSALNITTRLGKFYAFFDNLAAEKQVTHISIETPFLGKNAQNFLKLGYLRGVLNLLCYQKNYVLLEFSPREIKNAVTGYGHADKEQIASALSMLFPTLKTFGKMPLDATDALAVSLCAGLNS